MPDSTALRAIRQHIGAHWEDLRAILNQRNFKKLFGSLEGERLVRPPVGFPSDHPAVDLLRYKQLYVGVTEPPALAEGPKLFPRLLTLFAGMIPLIRFLNAPLSPRRFS